MPSINFSAVEQIHASGLTIRQDFRNSSRFVMFETDYPGWEYATHGGTAFIVNYKHQFFGITCGHVRGVDESSFPWAQLVLTDEKFGRRVSGISAVYYPSNPTKAAVKSDLLDIVAIKLSDDVSGAFFKDSAYIIDDGSVCQSNRGDTLFVHGALKDESSIGDNTISPTYALLEVVDQGPSKSDIVLREAAGKYVNLEFKSVTGLSGSPVFNATQGKLAGMAMRGSLHDEKAVIWFAEISDIIKILCSITDGSLSANYTKAPTPHDTQGGLD